MQTVWSLEAYTLGLTTVRRDRAVTRVGAVADEIRRRVASRQLATGERLPSVRGLATTLGVSPSTVVEAYDRLVAEGLIGARRGSGFYVASAPPLRLATAVSRRDQAVDPFWVSRESLNADATTLKPGCGWLPADWMPVDAVRRALREVARGDDRTLVDYGDTHGSYALRRLLAARLGIEGIGASPEQLMLTPSGTSAIDLVCRFILRPGDTVLVDDPCYFNFRALLRAHAVNVIGVPCTPTGPDIDALEAVVARGRPRLYLTNSAIQNPTGATLSPPTAHRLLGIAARAGFTIVEDDIFSDFEPEPTVRLAALDGLDRVIRIGSHSKTLSASMRCGYIATKPEWIEGLVDLQIATGFSGPGPATTAVIASVISAGGYRKHLEELRRRLARARRDTARRLQGLGIVPWLMPRGGFYLWCRLPDGRDSTTVARRAREEQVVLAPGNVFSVSQSASAFMRFNVAQCGPAKVWDVLATSLTTAPRSTRAAA